jgi:hypothetical protein
MPVSRPTRVLIVAHQAVDGSELVWAVACRAGQGPCSFAVMVPVARRGLHRVRDPRNRDYEDAEAQLNASLPLVSRACGEDVIGFVGVSDPLAAVEDALNLLGFDEVIIAMPPMSASRWRDLELPGKVRALGVDVTVVVTRQDPESEPAA